MAVQGVSAPGQNPAYQPAHSTSHRQADDTVARLRVHGAELLGEVAQYESIFRLLLSALPCGHHRRPGRTNRLTQGWGRILVLNFLEDAFGIGFTVGTRTGGTYR